MGALYDTLDAEVTVTAEYEGVRVERPCEMGVELWRGTELDLRLTVRREDGYLSEEE